MLELEQSKFSCTYTFNVILFYYWYQYLYNYMDEVVSIVQQENVLL